MVFLFLYQRRSSVLLLRDILVTLRPVSIYYSMTIHYNALRYRLLPHFHFSLMQTNLPEFLLFDRQLLLIMSMTSWLRRE